jgi:hypothetical protein
MTPTARLRRISCLFVLLVPALTAAAPPETGQTFQAPGATLYVEVLGTAGGAPLVVVNGGPGFDHTYEHVTMPGATSAWDQLAKTRRVVFYDQRGTSRSVSLKPGQSCTLADHIDDLEAVRARLGADKIDQAIAKFYTDHAGKSARMADMLSTIQSVTGYDPTTCAQSWLRSTTVPTPSPCP